MTAPGIILLAVMAVAGCGGAAPASPEQGPGSDESTATEIELRYDETVELEKLKLRWLELRDSRCPIGVTCFWAGETVATLEVVRGHEPSLEVELVNRPGRQPEAAHAFDYELRLLGVDPHPRDGVTPERADYVARIEIAGP